MTVSQWTFLAKRIVNNIKDMQSEKENFASCPEEALNLLRHRMPMDTPVMVLEELDGEVSGVNQDNLRDNITFTFSILKKFKDGDFADRTNALDDCKRAGFRVLANIYQYKQNGYKGGGSSGFLAFDPMSITYEETLPVYDNAIGFTFSFVLASPLTLYFDPEQYITDV